MSAPGELDHEAFEAQCREGIEAWVAEHLHGSVEDIERLERWRPQWKVTYRAGDERTSVLFRGNRPIAPVEMLRFEMEVMQVLEANGICVPHIHGWVGSPPAFVMDWVDTEDRAPGMLHTAIDNPSTMSDERWQATLGYMEHLAQLHAVPVAAFADVEGMPSTPTSPDEIALHATEYMYDIGTLFGTVDPPIKFIQSWLRRHVPDHRREVNFVAGDAGQFMSAGTDVVALLDFEIANLGDTHWDLACFRGRHPYENMGDIPALYRRYEEVTGTPVDLPVVCYYTAAFLQLAGIGASLFMMPDVRGANWIEGILERASVTRRALEAIAEVERIELDHDLQLPEPSPDPVVASGLSKLVSDLGRLPTSAAFAQWERDLLVSIPELLLHYTGYRNWFEQETVADIAQLVGKPIDDLASADDELRALIETADSAMDGELVRVLHRRTLRLSMMIVGTDPDEANPLFYVLEPILP